MKKSLIAISLIGMTFHAQAFYEPIPPKKKASKANSQKVAGNIKKSSNGALVPAKAVKVAAKTGSKTTSNTSSSAASSTSGAMINGSAPSTKPAIAATSSASKNSTNTSMANSFKAQPIGSTATSSSAAAPTSLVAPQTQTQTLKATSSVTEKPSTGPWKFNGIFSITREAQMKNQEKDGNVTRAESLGFDLIPKITYDKYSAALWLVYSRDLKTPEESDWGDPILILARSPWDLGKYFKYSLSGLGVFPLSKASREVKEFKGGAGLVNKIILNTANMGAPNLSLSGSLGLSTNFFDSTTDLNGEPLTQNSVNQKFDIGYSIGSFSMSAFFYHYSRISYQGATRESVWHGAELGWEFNPNFNVAMGIHNNNAPLYKAPNYDFNLKLIDDEATMIYAKLGFAW